MENELKLPAPDLADAHIRRFVAGIRPFREGSVRLEAEQIGERWVIHNYGYGGSGITLACGTGACAVCVAGVLTGRTGRKLLAHLPGGDLDLEWSEADNHVTMTGPATEVFSGVWNG